MNAWNVRMENTIGEVMHIDATSEYGDEDSLKRAFEIVNGARALFGAENMDFEIVCTVEDEKEES